MKEKKIIAIGDIHGRRAWKIIVAENPDVDRIVFIGDYFDTHESVHANRQIVNFREILELKDKDPRVVLLIGNHDFHYLSEMEEMYSGYNHEYAKDIEKEVRAAIEEGKLQFCFRSGDYLFTHAGVSEGWCEDNNVDVKDIEKSINSLPLTAFKYDRRDNSGFGEYPRQTPIWIRPDSLKTYAVKGFHQVVGHTQQEELVRTENVDFIDCLGTSGQHWSSAPIPPLDLNQSDCKQKGPPHGRP